MSYEERYEPEIDLKDLFFHVLYRWRSVMAVAVACCALLSAYKAARMAELTPEERVPKKVREYELALERYELDKASYEREIGNDLERLEQQREYVEKSVLMRMDPYHMPIASADIFVHLDSTEWKDLPDNLGLDPTDGLLKMYTSNFSATLDWKPIEELTGDEKIYLEEVLEVTVDYNSNAVSVRIVHSDDSLAPKILDIILNQIQDKQNTLANGMGQHTLTIANQSLTYIINQSLAEDQKTNIATIANYERSIIEHRAQLDELKENKPSKPFIIGFIKYPIAGFVLGIMLMIVIYGMRYFFDGKLHGNKSLQYKYGYRLLGAFPRTKKTGFFHCIDRLLDKLSNDYEILEKKEIYKRISLNVVNLAGNNKNILVTGTVGIDQLQKIADAIISQDEGLTLTVSEDTCQNPETLNALAKCDAVLLVEQIEKSLSSCIRNECADITALAKPVIGYVLI